MPQREPADPFASPLSRGIFEARGRNYSLGQVLAAAAFGGWIGSFWTDLSEAVACETYAEDEGFEVDADELQSAADRFRYERNIVTAEETERWLADRDLDEDDLVGHLERRYWHERFRLKVPELSESYPPLPASIAEVLWPDVVCSGSLGSLALPLARRVAGGAADETATPEAVLEELSAEARKAFFERARCGPEGLLDWLDRNRCTMEWFCELLTLEARYRKACAEALSPRRFAAALDARRLDLMRIRFVVARFGADRRAREAYRCINDDGEDFGEAARRAGASAEEKELLLEDAPESLRTHLLSAARGEVVVVEDPGDGPSIVKVIDKLLPGAADRAVRARLEPVLVSRHFDPLVETDVHWTVPREPGP
jgi:hypothetical protein